ncbi:MAG: hypothetical protein JW941_07680 [Candidatus Coatesbacteria bacterium]|nr:hypothetical protein [Candidatus Coatesbacteria bacterium]
MRRQVPLIICFVAGVAMLAQSFIPPLTWFYTNALAWGRIIGCIALFIGLISLVRVHTTRLKRKSANWQFSIITLVALFYMMAAGLLTRYGFFSYLHGKSVAGSIQDSFVIYLENAFNYQDLFLNIQIPIQATMFSLLAFYIASAAFRAFKARTFEATLLLAAAMIVMLGRVPLGQMIPWISEITNWILDVPNTAAKRGIMIGVGLGMSSTALKIMLGIERTYLGMKD